MHHTHLTLTQRRLLVVAAVAALAAVTLAAVSVPAAAMTGGAMPAARAGMVRLPAGEFRPLYGRADDPAVRVASFQLDRDAVTRDEFLAFARVHPEWAPSKALAGTAGAKLPVTWVTRSAARAFCASRGKRLPTLDEWEYAAAASETSREASRDPAFRDALVAAYAKRGLGARPVPEASVNAWGVRGLHDNVWEWVEDPHRGHAGHAPHGAPGRTATAADQTCASASVGTRDPSDFAAFLRAAMRAGLTEESTLGSLGFRCAA